MVASEPATESGAAAAVFLVDKPVGPSSFRIVQQVRRALGIRKVGHAGTLDPFASGLLVICAGRPATRLIAQLMAGDKEYEATLRLGVETDTQDLEGTIVATRPVPLFDRATVARCLAGFVGEQLQTPPRFSALKYQGKPLYYYARRGVEVSKEPRRVVISRIDCLDLGPDTLTIRVACGKGTYIRALAQDIGAVLGCGAHLIELRRLRSGPFSVSDSLPGTALAEREEARELLAASRRSVEEILDLLKEWQDRGASPQQ
ncbi:MAG: tRNA pseudouridine(55) synthase TruB [Deltaproteobacteria bacterium RIFOXYD12_FULL_57_12]|nr:MAG: tRNA pseudouridine(55) synthase TruB [Deltaproteobacteria bacterium RIFOXYD12_FULL_57_12]